MRKSAKCILGLVFILGVNVILLNFGSPAFRKSFSMALNTSYDHTIPTLCMVTRIYSAQILYFPVLALGLYHNGLHNIRIYLINTDSRTNIQQLEQTVKFINELILRQDFITLHLLGKTSGMK